MQTRTGKKNILGDGSGGKGNYDYLLGQWARYATRVDTARGEGSKRVAEPSRRSRRGQQTGQGRPTSPSKRIEDDDEETKKKAQARALELALAYCLNQRQDAYGSPSPKLRLQWLLLAWSASCKLVVMFSSNRPPKPSAHPRLSIDLCKLQRADVER